jgi:drug/metabolite transporter (DMT)-like permease
MKIIMTLSLVLVLVPQSVSSFVPLHHVSHAGTARSSTAFRRNANAFSHLAAAPRTTSMLTPSLGSNGTVDASTEGYQECSEDQYDEQLAPLDCVLVQDKGEQSIHEKEESQWRSVGDAVDPKQMNPVTDTATATTYAWTEVEPMDAAAVNNALASSSMAGVTVPTADGVTTTATVTATATTTNDQETAATAKAEASAKEVNKARILLLAAAALYGTNFSLVKMLGETDIPVGVSSALRFGMAALITSPWLIPPRTQHADGTASYSLDAVMKGPELAATLAGLEVGMWNSIGYVSQAVGLETTAASKSAFLCSLAVVVVPILDYLSGKLLLSRQVVGAVLALLGVAFLELGGMDSSDLSLSGGDLASLLQPLAFGMGFWRMEKAMQKFPNHANRSTAAQLLAVFMGSALYAVVTERAATFDVHQLQLWLSDPMILASLFWTGCITTALTVYMETVALKTLSAAETTLIFSTEPLWGTAFAAAVMGEQLGPAAAAGAFFILSGCVYSNLGFAGIQSFLFPNKETNGAIIEETDLSLLQLELKEEETATTTETTVTSVTPPLKEPFNFSFEMPMTKEKWAMLRAGVAASIGASTAGMWSDIQIGTKVLAHELQDVMENILPFSDN